MTSRLVQNADIEWNDQEFTLPRSARFDDIYFADTGIAEARHVFVDANRLSQRFSSAQTICIGELGFGSGLNFLSTWKLWDQTKKPEGARLNFLTFERFPLTKADAERASARWNEFRSYRDRLLAAWPPPVRGFHQIAISPDVTLTVYLGDINDGLTACTQMQRPVDAWFLDGFSPAKNPKMWSADVFEKMAVLSRTGTTLSTFTVAGHVRRGLIEAGFTAEKAPGFGRKRHMLVGTFLNDNNAQSPSVTPYNQAPWFTLDGVHDNVHGARIAIIGGGIAGASLAFALRQQGFMPTILDPEGLATNNSRAASGNPAGLIMPRLDRDDGPTARFFTHAWLYTLTLINSFTDDFPTLFRNCGVARLALEPDEIDQVRTLINANLLPEDWIRSVNGGIVFPHGGVIDPPVFIRCLAGSTPVINEAVKKFYHYKDHIVIEISDIKHYTFDAVIIANGLGALRFIQARGLPLTGSLGQLDHYTDDYGNQSARTWGPYACPTPNGSGTIVGASYHHADANTVARPSTDATQENLARLANYDPALAGSLNPAQATPRASIRCTTTDRLPIAGPLPDWRSYGVQYDDLRFGRRATKNGPYAQAVYQKNIHILTGLGSRGLVTAPYCAAMIAAQMAHMPAPAGQDIHDLLHPGRFFIRDLKRAKTTRT